MARPKLADRVAANPGFRSQSPGGLPQKPLGLHSHDGRARSPSEADRVVYDATGVAERTPWAEFRQWQGISRAGMQAPQLSDFLRDPDSNRVGGAFSQQSVGRDRLGRRKVLRQATALWPDEASFEQHALDAPVLRPIKYVCAKPGTVRLHAPIAGLDDAAVGEFVGIQLLRESHLTRLQQADFDVLLDTLASSKHTAHWHFSGWKGLEYATARAWQRSQKLSGTSVLVLHLMARHEPRMVDRILCKRPVEVANELATALPELFALPSLNHIFKNFLPAITCQRGSVTATQDKQISAMGVMIAAFLATHAHADPARIEAWTIALMQQLEGAGFATTSPNLGLLAGVIFAGSLRHSAAITHGDKARLQLIKYVSLVLFACTTFIPDTRWVGALAVMAVIVGIALERYWPVRDLSVFSNKLQGKLGARLANLDMFKSPYDRDLMMDWINIAKLCNGF